MASSRDIIEAIDSDIDPKQTLMVIVIVSKREYKPKIKARLDAIGIQS